jgi:mevalonate kinase
VLLYEKIKDVTDSFYATDQFFDEMNKEYQQIANSQREQQTKFDELEKDITKKSDLLQKLKIEKDKLERKVSTASTIMFISN